MIIRQEGFRPGDQPGRGAVDEGDPSQTEDEAPGLVGQNLVQVLGQGRRAEKIEFAVNP